MPKPGQEKVDAEKPKDKESKIPIDEKQALNYFIIIIINNNI